MLPIIVKSIPNFESLSLHVFELDKDYFPIKTLSEILGYSNPQSLLYLLPDYLRYDIEDLYSLYMLYLEQFNTYVPLNIKEFKKNLSRYKPLWFTDKEGINYVLSRNTFTTPRIKNGLAQLLGFSLIATPHKESIFYDVLSSLLKGTELSIQRHVYIAGYFVDVEITGDVSVIVEFDENDHKYYDQDKEIIRENALRSLGYMILRVNDSVDMVESASEVYKKIINLMEKNNECDK